MVKRKPPVVVLPHRASLERTVAAIVTGPEHSAMVELCRSLADSVDAAVAFDDKLWREYRMALRALMDRTSGGSSDDFDAEFDALRTSVGDSAKS